MRHGGAVRILELCTPAAINHRQTAQLDEPLPENGRGSFLCEDIRKAKKSY